MIGHDTTPLIVQVNSLKRRHSRSDSFMFFNECHNAIESLLGLVGTAWPEGIVIGERCALVRFTAGGELFQWDFVFLDANYIWIAVSFEKVGEGVVGVVVIFYFGFFGIVFVDKP